MPRKMVLIDSRPRSSNRDNLIDIGLLLLGTHISKRFTELTTEIIDLGLELEEFRGSTEFESMISSANLIGLSCGTSIFYKDTLKLAKQCRHINPTVPIVIGGHHANILPQDFLKYPKSFDFVAAGWGETAMEEIASYLARHNYARPPQPLLISGPPLPPEKIVVDIDWTLLRKYFRSKTTIPAIYVKFARGCSQRCHFCTNSGNFRYQFRCISPDEALIQLRGALKFIVSEGVADPREYLLNRTNLCVSDELFGQNRDWQHKFLTKMIDSRSSLPYDDFNLFVDQRIDQFPQENVELFDRARVNVAFGIESFDPKILTNMGKTSNPARYLHDADRVLLHPTYTLKKTHYNIMLIFGFPSETHETLNHTGNILQTLTRELIEPIAIQGMFFGLIPSTEVYNNMSHYERTFGSKFHFPRWWREDLPLVKSVINDPSHEFSFNNLFQWVTSIYPTIFEGLNEQNFTKGAPAYFHSDLKHFREFIQKCLHMRDLVKELLPNSENQQLMKTKCYNRVEKG